MLKRGRHAEAELEKRSTRCQIDSRKLPKELGGYEREEGAW